MQSGLFKKGIDVSPRKTKKLTCIDCANQLLNDVLEARLELARTFLPKGF